MYRLIILLVTSRIGFCSFQQARDDGKYVFVYPKHTNSERDLTECGEHEACNVVYKRFWMPPLIERQCRCRPPLECNWMWSTNPDNTTVALDNRTQLKFCKSIRTLKECSEDQEAIKVKSKEMTEQKMIRREESRGKGHTRTAEPRTIQAKCYCPEPHNWVPVGGSNSSFKCAKLDTCFESEVCGFVRKDLYSISYRCSCPEDHTCVTHDKRTHLHNLLLYSGPVFTAICTKLDEENE